MSKWELRSVEPHNHTARDLLLRAGWEPFAVTPDKLWFRFSLQKMIVVVDLAMVIEDPIEYLEVIRGKLSDVLVGKRLTFKNEALKDFATVSRVNVEIEALVHVHFQLSAGVDQDNAEFVPEEVVDLVGRGIKEVAPNATLLRS